MSSIQRLLSKYPDHVPIVLSPGPFCRLKPEVHGKYLVPTSQTVGQFAYNIRKRISLKSSQALFVFVNNVLLPTGATFGEVYPGNNEIMYITYTGENTFG
jgi:hypothetical protein